jgi:hypothetical protein
MDLFGILAGVLRVALIGLGIVYWRSRLASQATEAALRQDLESLKATSAQIQQDLTQKYQESTEKLQVSQREKAELAERVEALTQQCMRLRANLEQQALQVAEDSRAASFQEIQMLLTQYPSVRRMVESKPDLPARNLVAMLTALDNLMKFWGYQQIGSPWESVAYDPQLHQGDCGDMQPEESVYIRFVGYRIGDRILVPAKVSRTLPAGAIS